MFVKDEVIENMRLLKKLTFGGNDKHDYERHHARVSIFVIYSWSYLLRIKFTKKIYEPPGQLLN